MEGGKGSASTSLPAPPEPAGWLSDPPTWGEEGGGATSTSAAQKGNAQHPVDLLPY